MRWRPPRRRAEGETVSDGALCCSLFTPPGQSGGSLFGQQGLYNNMSITVSMAGGSGAVAPLPPMGQAAGTGGLGGVGSACGEQQVSSWWRVDVSL